MRPRRYLVLLTLFASAPLQAEPKDPPLVPPPMAQPQTLSIFRGENIEVPLSAQGRAPSQLKFLIRSLPSKGRLGEIRVTGPKSAEVSYFHDETSEGSDSFTFAVQAIDSPVSAAAPITISICEEPPTLSVVKSVDFGTMEVGTTREGRSSCEIAEEANWKGRWRFLPRGESLVQKNTDSAAAGKHRATCLCTQRTGGGTRESSFSRTTPAWRSI